MLAHQPRVLAGVLQDLARAPGLLPKALLPELSGHLMRHAVRGDFVAAGVDFADEMGQFFGDPA